MAKSKQQIIIEIKDHIKVCGSAYPQWYIGVTENPEERLFTGHNVKRQGDSWIYREAENSIISRQIEKYFVEVLGTDGGSGGGDYDARFVYAYKKSSNTNH